MSFVQTETQDWLFTRFIMKLNYFLRSLVSKVTLVFCIKSVLLLTLTDWVSGLHAWLRMTLGPIILSHATTGKYGGNLHQK